MSCRNTIILSISLMLILSCAILPPLSTEPQVDCPIETLILNENLLPPGAYAEKIKSPSPDQPKESAIRGFSYGSDLIISEVIHSKYQQWAQERFEERTETVFDQNKYMGPWHIPEEIEFTSSVADELLLGCGVAHNVYQCRMIAVYESYFIYFKADVSAGGITLQDVEKMLSGIDDRMEVCLGEE